VGCGRTGCRWIRRRGGRGFAQGDVLEAINGEATPRLAPQVRAMYTSGTWARASYYDPAAMAQGSGDSRIAGAKFPVQVYLEPEDRNIARATRLIALVYLLIGLYVLFRRWTAPKSTHFYVFAWCRLCCMRSGRRASRAVFDRVIYWGNLARECAAAGAVPALRGELLRMRTRRTMRCGDCGAAAAVLLYVPGALLAGLQVWAIERWSATELLSHRLDQIGVGYMALYYVIAAVVFYTHAI
jgi:two-component system NtrC family sensor kinase